MADWHVGMQVVCIAYADPLLRRTPYERAARYPVKGCVYTIRDFYPGKPETILLEEIVNSPPRPGAFEAGFNRGGFRPVRKTSIDIFRSLLTPTGDDGAATPRSPARVSFPSDLVQERGCHHANPDHALCLSPGIPSRRATLAHALPAKVDGRAPLLHSLSSPMPKSSSVLVTKHGVDGHGIH